jgi:hypothetical protein
MGSRSILPGTDRQIHPGCSGNVPDNPAGFPLRFLKTIRPFPGSKPDPVARPGHDGQAGLPPGLLKHKCLRFYKKTYFYRQFRFITGVFAGPDGKIPACRFPEFI